MAMLALSAAGFLVKGPIVGVILAFVTFCTGIVLWTPLRGWLGIPPHESSRETRLQKVKEEIAHIQRDLLRMDTCRRETRSGSIWPIRRPFQILPADQWNEHRDRLGLSADDHRTIAEAYELANDFNNAVLTAEGTIAGVEPEPSLDAVREAFDAASGVLATYAPTVRKSKPQ
jgi:hypothetical protein